MTKKRTEIIVEITENIALENSGQCFEAFCSECGKMVAMTTPQACALRQQISEREIFRRIEAGRIHFVESDQIWICLESAGRL